MEVLTSMFSQILRENDDLEEPTLSIVTAVTQTLSLLEETREKASITRRKTDVLSLEDLSDRPTGLMDLQWEERMLSWLSLFPSRMLIRFGQVYKTWLQDYCYEISPALTVMHLGDSDQELRNIRRRLTFASILTEYLDWTNGEMSILELVPSE